MGEYFVSYTTCDQRWAEWIAWQLERAGHRTVIQSWDFRPGSNFVLAMQEALATVDGTVVVLSGEYLTRAFPASEWAASFVTDPMGKNRALIPVRISDVRPNGLLAAIVYVDLFGLTDEKVAIDRLLSAVTMDRVKPVDAPPFPGEPSRSAPRFPNSPEHRVQHSTEDLVEIEVRLNREFDSFTPREQDKFLSAIRALLATSSTVRISTIARGSIVLTLQLTRRDALLLIVLQHLGKLRELDITQVAPVTGFPLSLEEALAASVADSSDPPRIGRRESGRIVFLDEAAGVGIIERERGGFLRFYLWRNLPTKSAYYFPELPPHGPDRPHAD